MIPIPRPPAYTDADLRRYLQGIADLLNKFPPVSNFSLVSPNSFVTAARGTVGLNAASTASVLWVKQQGSGNTGWISIV